MTYSKYRMIPDELKCFDSSDEDDEDEAYFNMDDNKRDIDYFETKQKELGEMPRSGLKKIGDKVVSNSDGIPISGIKLLPGLV